MTSTVTKSFRIHNARQFKEAFSEQNDTKMYLFIAREKEWDTPSSPPAIGDSVQLTEYDAYRNMIAAKKIVEADVEFGIPRVNWESGTVYHEYQNKDTDLYANNFYVVNDSFDVYKCIFNNNGNASTVEPTAQLPDATFVTSDDYQWKFMYSISSAEQEKFVNDTFVPIKEVTTDDGSQQFSVQQAAANGAIGAIDVGTPGSGFKRNQSTFFSVANSTTFVANTTANATPGIFTDSFIFIKAGTGAGQVRRIINWAGATRTLTVNTAFSVVPDVNSTYLIGPAVTITGDGEGALGYADVNGDGGIANVTLISSGVNYSKANTVISANGGSGASAQTYLAPFGGHGSDPVKELGGHNIIINVRLDSEDFDNLANADFRTIGLLKDPLLANGSISNNNVLNMTTRLDLIGKSGSFAEDERILGATSGATGRVVVFANNDTNGTLGELSLVELEGTFTNTETITANNSGTTATINGITASETLDFSGEVLYLENLQKVQRAEDQTEDIKLVIRF